MNTKMQNLFKEVRASKEYFDRSTRPLTEADSQFAPKPEMHTVAQQVTHVARSIEYFIDFAFKPQGGEMDYAEYEGDMKKVTSLNAARAELERAYAHISELIQSKPPSEWEVPLPPGDMMGGEPRWAIIPALIEHTAHHRGALTVYTRLLGKKPPMPYMETTDKK